MWGFFYGGTMDWYPWHYKKFREKTLHLTAEQDGIYRRLIDYYMEIRKPLPCDDVSLARIAGVDVSCFKQASSILKAFFTEEEGTLKHKMCDEMLDEQDRVSRFRTERARKGAEARHRKTAENKESSASSKQEAMLNPATITETDNSKEDTNVSSKKKFNHEDLKIDHISDWLLEKRVGGKYLTIDEYALLEMFKDYCRSKNPKYKDYIAAFRNAFNWKNAPTYNQGEKNDRKSKLADESRELLDAIREGRY